MPTSPQGKRSPKPTKKSGQASWPSWAPIAVTIVAVAVALTIVIQQQQDKPQAPAQQQEQQTQQQQATQTAQEQASQQADADSDAPAVYPPYKHPPATKPRPKRVTKSAAESEERRKVAEARVQADLKREGEVVVGNKTYHASFGIFPPGCKWRTITTAGSNEVDYEFWNAAQNAWLPGTPAECSPTGFNASTQPKGWDFHNGTPRSEVSCDEHACIYNNFYYNNGKWYALVDGETNIPTWRFSRNQEVSTLHFTDVRQWLNSVKWRVIPGTTLMFDFIFYTHPTAIGHWWEMLGPMYSTLKRANIKRPPDNLVLLHLQRQHILEWVRAMLAVTLASPADGQLPPVYMQKPVNDGASKLSSIIEGFEPDTWYIFEYMAITKDLYTGGGRTFVSMKDAREFRGLVYEHYGLPPPTPHSPVPKTITFQRKRANRRILNEQAVVDLLKQYGDLEVVEYNSSSSLYQQLQQMRKTGVYVSVHTSNLANSPLLQGGSAVVELLHRNWHWNGLDTSFKDQTAMMGDIHHYAWRAHFLNQTEYLDPRDLAKIGHWPASVCGSEECVEAHTRVDLRVDIDELKQLLDDRLPHVFAGKSVHEAQIPWPPARDIEEDAVIPP